jgi:dUTP pyrophosphatase
MEIKVMLEGGAFMPTKAHDLDTGFDIYAKYDFTVPPTTGWIHGDIADIDVGAATHDTGVHIQIPKGYTGLLKSKSGLNVKHGLTSEGVIDSGYTGSIRVKLYNHTSKAYKFQKGDKISQLAIMPIADVNKLVEVTEFEATERGNGGFGSTGR